jgi:outer membrane protein OmpA-like peptidoglycan-associated protein
MKFRKFIMRFIALTIFLALSIQIHAQESSTKKYGVYADYGLNMHSADFRALPGIPNCCTNFQEGDGLGLSMGALFEMDMTSHLFLAARLGYTDISGELRRYDQTTVIIDNAFEDGEFTHTINSSIQAVTARILAGYRIIPNLSFYSGFGVGNVINATFDQVETLSKPSDKGTFVDEQGFDTGSRTRNEFSGDIPELNSIRLFLSTGIGYELPLNSDNSIRLMPEVNFDFAFSNVVNGIDWSINELKGGIALKYVPQNDRDWKIIRDTVIVRDTTIEYITENKPSIKLINTRVLDESEKIEGHTKIITTTVEKKYLHRLLDPSLAENSKSSNENKSSLKNTDISITAKGVDYNGNLTSVATMKVEEFISDVIHPLLPYIFFDHNSSVVPDRYTQYKKLEEFTESSLINDETLEVYYNLLNIVGRRLKDNPKSTIKLIGTNSNTGEEKDNTKLSQERAIEVKNYFVNAWGIDANRIKTEARNLPQNASNTTVEDGIAENRRVEIYSSDNQILDVIMAKDTLRKADPPTLRFMTEYKGNEDYENWKVVVSQNGITLKEYNGNGTLPKSIDWNLEQEQGTTPRFDSPLDYKLVLTKGGETAEANAQLPMQMIKLSEKAINKVGDKRIDKFNLILFDFNSSEISGRNSDIIDIIDTRIEDNSTIQIKGYTDRMGDEALNERLSNSRAESANKALGNSNAISKGYGEKIELYNNDLPEGRMYNRTVEIIVETPVK